MLTVLLLALSRFVIGVLFLHGTLIPFLGPFSLRFTGLSVGAETSHPHTPSYFEEAAVGLRGMSSVPQYLNKLLSFLQGRVASRFSQLMWHTTQKRLQCTLFCFPQFVVRPFWRPLSFGNGSLTDPLLG